MQRFSLAFLAAALALPLALAPHAVAQASTEQDALPELNRQEVQIFEAAENERLRLLEANPSLRYRPRIAQPHSVCGNGDFEGGLDPSEWSGGHGKIGEAGKPDAGDPDFEKFTSGLQGGPLTQKTSHQTWVPAGADSTVGISQVAPVGLQGVAWQSSHAVRIGNSADGYGSELLSKTFTVTSSNSLIKFWYAVVFENPDGHSSTEQPSFWVRVLDSANQEIPNLVNLGNQSDKIVSDQSNPFFQEKPGSSPRVLYRDWSCAEIDLTSQIGSAVTVQFVTEDCALGAHYGYAYIDNFCGSCQGDPSGSISLERGLTSDCGRGHICFKYDLPTAGAATGEVQIELSFLQEGAVISKVTSPQIGSGSRHCFSIDPAQIQNLSPQLEGFDFAATAKFSIQNHQLASKSVGTMTDGITPGRNNDYEISCSSGGCEHLCCLAPCCIGAHCIETTAEYCKIRNGLFHPDSASCELGNCQLGDLCFPTSQPICASKNGIWLGKDGRCPVTINL